MPQGSRRPRRSLNQDRPSRGRATRRESPMRTPAGRFIFAAFLAASLLACRPGGAHAHPQLAGRWSAPVPPPGGSMAFDFGCGEYIGEGVWRGPFVFIVSGKVVEQGMYELRT